MKNRSIILAKRPIGNPKSDDFVLQEGELPDIQDNEILVKNFAISLDAGFRNWMNEDAGDEILPAMSLGEPVMGLSLCEVIGTKNSEYAVGDKLMARFAWQEYSIGKPGDFISKLPSDLAFPYSYYLGVLGDTGMSAYFALTEIAPPKEGQTVLISAAGGAVGSIAGQIAKIYGARAVGITSSPEKCDFLVNELGYDAAVNRKAPEDQAEAIKAVCPDGVDIFLDNVGGETLQAAITNMNHRGRIVMIGAVTHYTSEGPPTAPNNLFELSSKEITAQGLMTHFRHDQYDDVRQHLENWLSEGKLKSFEHKLNGIENVGVAFCQMFDGKNFGKTVVDL
ncbi:MAG: NADP-dependent oxidoreductase [Pseudomonadota bacterium]|nr:NADP-dependent oxidoreductase [Pseudomonadota bacterium]